MSVVRPLKSVSSRIILIYSDDMAHLEHLQQSPNTTPLIRWYWGSLISLSRFIVGVAVAVRQYISHNTHMKGGSHKCVRENMAKKW
jgi:hypothetical protein